MAKTDRLYALVEELRVQAPRPVTRAELARRLETSQRTIERDIATLQQAGVPIWSERGRAGGYALDAGWHLPPLNFDATEALAVVVALAAAESLPFAEPRRRAALKILSAMRVDESTRAKNLAARVHVERPAPRTHSDLLRRIEEAVADRRVVELQYMDQEANVTRRLVEAHGIHVASTGSHLIGWCRLRDDARAFKVDRIGSLRVTTETAPERDIESMVDWFDGRPSVEATMAELKPRRRTGGPPGRADDQTGSSRAFAAAVARQLPGVEADGDGFSVSGAAFLEFPDDESADVQLAPDHPEPFRVSLDRIGRDELRELIRQSWSNHAPAKSKAALMRRLARTQPPLTLADIKAVIARLPGVTERAKRGRTGEALTWEASKTMFVKFGEASNLLAPDVTDTLMIRRCPDRPSLLATSPDRFFITRHYGDPDEPGPVLTRLSENTREHLGELEELIIESWRDVAPMRVVAAFDP